MIWLTLILLLSLEVKESSTQEDIEVLSLKNIDVKRGEKVATLMYLSKSFKIDFEFCFTTVGESNNLKGRKNAFFRFGPSNPKVCDLKCQRMQFCRSKYLYGYFERTLRDEISMILGNCLAGYYRENYLPINPGCTRFQITQFRVNETYWSTIKINNTEVSKFQNKHPEEQKFVDLLFSDAEYAPQHGVVSYLNVANEDCCILGEWTAWGECSSTCKTVLSVPQQNRIRKCLSSGINCKSIEEFQNCNELDFCTGYFELLNKKNFEVKEGQKLVQIKSLSKSFEIDFEFCFTTAGENENLNKSTINLFCIGQKEAQNDPCNSKYLTAFFEPPITNEINLKFGQCLGSAYSEKDLSVSPGCIRFQIAQLFVKESYQSSIKVDNVELFNFQNKKSKVLLDVAIFFSDVQSVSQPGIVKYISVANADCCVLGEWSEWSECSETCYIYDVWLPTQMRERNCLNAVLNKECYESSMYNQVKNCNEIPCPSFT